MNNVMQIHLSIRDGHDRLAGIRSELPDVFTPSLPPELWLQIFRYAAANDDHAEVPRGHHSCSHSFITHIQSHAYLPE